MDWSWPGWEAVGAIGQWIGAVATAWAVIVALKTSKEAKKTAEELAKPKLEISVDYYKQNGTENFIYIATNIRQIPILITRINIELYWFKEISWPMRVHNWLFRRIDPVKAFKIYVRHLSRFETGSDLGFVSSEKINLEGLPRKIEPGETFRFVFSKEWLKEFINQLELKHKQFWMDSFFIISKAKRISNITGEFAEKSYDEYLKMKGSKSYKIVIRTFDSTKQYHDYTFYYNIPHDLVQFYPDHFRMMIFTNNLEQAGMAGMREIQERISTQRI